MPLLSLGKSRSQENCKGKPADSGCAGLGSGVGPRSLQTALTRAQSVAGSGNRIPSSSSRNRREGRAPRPHLGHKAIVTELELEPRSVTKWPELSAQQRGSPGCCPAPNTEPPTPQRRGPGSAWPSGFGVGAHTVQGAKHDSYKEDTGQGICPLMRCTFSETGET